MFPRPQNRGPIEARSSAVLPLIVYGFRGLKTAAPLKPSVADPAAGWANRFRGLKTAAPLKLHEQV